MTKLIDTHCHLDFPLFDEDRVEVIARAKQNNIEKIIIPSITQQYWQRVDEIQQRYPENLLVAYGLHPMFMSHHKKEHINLLDKKLSEGKAIAIGECGLDFYYGGLGQSHANVQIEYFDLQLKLAKKYNLPVIIHARKSIDTVLKMLRQYGGLTGVIHSFSGSLQQAEYCIKEGFLLGFGGPITYPRATKLRALVTILPIEKLVLESDAPDQVGQSHYGKRNEPAYLTDTLEVMAELKELSTAYVAQQTTTNIKDVLAQ
ncbi:MAG TPA: TatD family deoxyribonuclease [Thiotrichaceae bacterium]|nr:TatD family deoxyribonuclease [Thiotrichaceae bacterium]